MLAVSDVESGRYYTWYRDGILKEFDLIVSCGDLKREYLEFLVTMANKPLLYVPGNHDDDFEKNPPEGCVPIDGRVHSVQGVRFLGLGGSYRYKKEGKYMYTEEQMRRRIRRLELSLRVARRGGCAGDPRAGPAPERLRLPVPPGIRMLPGAAGPVSSRLLHSRAHPSELRNAYPKADGVRGYGDLQRLRAL